MFSNHFTVDNIDKYKYLSKVNYNINDSKQYKKIKEKDYEQLNKNLENLIANEKKFIEELKKRN